MKTNTLLRSGMAYTHESVRLKRPARDFTAHEPGPVNKEVIAVRRLSFTLIELMLVIIIIGVLAAMVMPKLVGRSEQARIAAAQADIVSISTAVDLYEMDNGAFPQEIANLRTNPGVETWKGPYLKKDPKDPWGRVYEYSFDSGSGKEYKICSKGLDEGNSEDDICN